MVDDMMELSKRIIEVLEAHDINLCGEISERTYNNDGYDVELETYSPEGEDVIISLIYDGTEEDFIRQFERYAEDFDAEEHAETYINMCSVCVFRDFLYIFHNKILLLLLLLF